jgi:hypothetical protein
MTEPNDVGDALNRDSREFLSDAAVGDTPSAEDRERIRRALMLAVAGGAAASGTAAGAVVASGASGAASAGAGASGVAGAAAVGATVAGSSVAVKVVSAILVIGAIGAGAAGVDQLVRDEPTPVQAPVVTPMLAPTGAPAEAPVEAPQAVPQEVPALAPAEAEPVNVETPSAPENLALPNPSRRRVEAPNRQVERAGGAAAAVEPAAAPEPSAAVPQAPATAEGDALTQELSLLRRAQQARVSGSSAEALRLLQEHATRFPQGNLSHERRVSQILVMCESGQRERARILAERFLSRNGASPAAIRIRRACGL